MRDILHTRLRDKQGHNAGLCTYPLKGCRTSLLSEVWERSWGCGGGFLSLQHEGTGFNKNQGRCWTRPHFCLKTTTTAPTSHLKISRLILGVNCSFGFDIFSWRLPHGLEGGEHEDPWGGVNCSHSFLCDMKLSTAFRSTSMLLLKLMTKDYSGNGYKINMLI